MKLTLNSSLIPKSLWNEAGAKTERIKSILDVGTSPLWELPIMKVIARIVAFIYFLIKENPSRAWAEAAAVSNLRTPEGWHIDLQKAGFQTINIHKLPSKHRWTPAPLSIQSIYREEL